MQRRTARPWIFAVLAAALVLPACGSDDDDEGTGPENPAPQSVTITVEDDFFSPQVDTVAVGGEVTWQNAGQDTHTTTGANGEWDQELAPGTSHTEEFDAAGTYEYLCQLHQGMTGTLVVR